MPRPRKKRLCRQFDGDRVFKPRRIPMTDLDLGRMGLDELEAMRLCDLERLEQEEAGPRMRVSRGTVQRLLRSGRAKALRATLDSSALVIEKGDADVPVHPDRGRSRS